MALLKDDQACLSPEVDALERLLCANPARNTPSRTRIVGHALHAQG
jgi:hypothetical protein